MHEQGSAPMRGRRINLLDVPGLPLGSRTTRVVVAPGGPLETAGFSLGRSHIDPGGEVPAHRHPQEEVYHVIQGAGQLRIGTDVFPARAGDFFHIPPGVEHALVCGRDGPMELLWVYSPAGIVDHWAQERAQLAEAGGSSPRG